MKKEQIKVGFDTFTITVFQSTIGGTGRDRDRWELIITNQYDSQLLHTILDGSFALFLNQKTEATPDDLLMDYAKSEVPNLSKRSRGV